MKSALLAAACAIQGKEEECDTHPWFDFTLGWWEHKDDPKFLFVTYEDMKKDVRSVIVRICRFLDTKLEKETIDAILDHTHHLQI